MARNVVLQWYFTMDTRYFHQGAILAWCVVYSSLPLIRTPLLTNHPLLIREVSFSEMEYHMYSWHLLPRNSVLSRGVPSLENVLYERDTVLVFRGSMVEHWSSILQIVKKHIAHLSFTGCAWTFIEAPYGCTREHDLIFFSKISVFVGQWPVMKSIIKPFQK